MEALNAVLYPIFSVIFAAAEGHGAGFLILICWVVMLLGSNDEHNRTNHGRYHEVQRKWDESQRRPG